MKIANNFFFLHKGREIFRLIDLSRFWNLFLISIATELMLFKFEEEKNIKKSPLTLSLERFEILLDESLKKSFSQDVGTKILWSAKTVASNFPLVPSMSTPRFLSFVSKHLLPIIWKALMWTSIMIVGFVWHNNEQYSWQVLATKKWSTLPNVLSCKHLILSFHNGISF